MTKWRLLSIATAGGVILWLTRREGVPVGLTLLLACGLLFALQALLVGSANECGERTVPFYSRRLRRWWRTDLTFEKPSDRNLKALANAIQAPQWSGSVTGRRSPEVPARALVVCIQDLHANVGVQKHMSQIIGNLVNLKGFHHVFVEGASGAGDTQLLASLPLPIRWAFTRKLFAKAYLTGSEYAATKPGWDFELWGIDHPELYRHNWRAAEGIEVVRDNVVAAAEAFRRAVSQVCTPVASKELTDFLATVNRRREDLQPRNVVAHVQLLLLYSASYSIVLPARLSRLVQADDADGAETAGRGASRGTITDEHETEIRAVETEIAEAIARTSRNPADQPYILLLRTVELAARAFNLGMQSDEARSFFAFEARDLQQRIDLAVEQINGLLAPTDHRLTAPADFELVFAHWHLPQAFYRAALARSDVMLENVAKQVRVRKIDRAIFVSGGFHTSYVADQLAARHAIATVTITPHVEELNQDAAYRSRIREDMRTGPLEEATTPDFLDKLAMLVARLSSRMDSILTGNYRRRVTLSAQRFAATAPILDGNESVLELECSGTELLAHLSKRLPDGLIMGVDQFDYFLGGHEINLLSPLPYMERLKGYSRDKSVQIANMNPRFLKLADESVDMVVSLDLARIRRVGDRRQVLREVARVLKPGGLALMLSGRRSDEYARVLLRLGMKELSRVETIPFVRGSRFVAAQKAGGDGLKSRIALGALRRWVAGPDLSGQTVWRRATATSSD